MDKKTTDNLMLMAIARDFKNDIDKAMQKLQLIDRTAAGTPAIQADLRAYAKERNDYWFRYYSEMDDMKYAQYLDDQISDILTELKKASADGPADTDA